MKLMAAGVFVLKKRYFPLAVASCASLLLHGLLVAELLRTYSPGKNGMAATPARLQVVILAPSVAPQAINAPTAQAARPEKEPLPRRIPATRDIPRAPTPERAAATAAVAHVAEIPAETAFVLPFTPPTSSPLGRGSWGMAIAPQVHPQNGQFRIEQARAQFRAQLMDRLSMWVARQAQQRKEVSCLIRLNLDTRQTGMSCTPIEVEVELWSVLVGLVATAGPVIEGDTTCVRAGTDQLGTVACEDKAGP